MYSALTTGSVVAIASAFAAPGLADILYVDPGNPDPNVYATIQDALSAANSSGDEIVVAPGVYTSTSWSVISSLGKSVKIISSQGPGVTIIDGEHTRRCVSHVTNDSSFLELEGFTIRNGFLAFLNGAGVFVHEGNFAAVNCIFDSNHAYVGAAASVFQSISVFKGCTFRDNLATSMGGAIHTSSSLTSITSCTLRDNTSTDGGGIYATNTAFSLQLEDNYFCGNFPGGHYYLGPNATVQDLGNNVFNTECNDLLLWGQDWVLELEIYLMIPPCDPLDELIQGAYDFSAGDEIGNPEGIASSPEGVIAIADSEEGVVHAYDPEHRSYEGVLFQSDQMSSPNAVAFGGGQAFVSDVEFGVFVFDAASGAPQGNLGSGLTAPSDLEYGADGLLYVSTENSDAPIQAWDPASGGMRYAFGAGVPGLEDPGALAVLPNGSVLVLDRADSEIYAFDPALGSVESFLSASEAEALGFSTIKDIQLMPDNRVYVLSENGLSRFTLGGWFLGDLVSTGEFGIASIDALCSWEPDPHPWRPGDINLDDLVNGADLGLLLAEWGSASTKSRADIDLDGQVSGGDLGLLLANWTG